MYHVPDNIILHKKICGSLIFFQTFKNLTIIGHFFMASCVYLKLKRFGVF